MEASHQLFDNAPRESGKKTMTTSVTASGDDSIAIAATGQMCTYCFDVLLQHHLHPSSEHSNRDISFNSTQYSPPNVQCPLFVTWEKTSLPPPLLSKVSSSTGLNTSASSSIIDETSSTYNYNTDTPRYELRGCIGTLAPKQLSHALSEFAITSALHDRRFDPISLHELPFLRVGVSLLVNFEQCLHCFDWIVGVHGIIIKFGGDSMSSSEGGMEQHCYSATFLPEIAKEQSWDQKETILSLIRKAGYGGNITNEMLSRIQCTRYQSSKCRVSYQEYVAKCHDGEDPLGGNPDFMAAVELEMKRRKSRLRSNTCVTL